MRHRGVKNKDEIFSQFSSFIITDPKDHKGNWQALFENKQPIHLEVGSGKGQFICSLALKNPDINYLACECLPDVYVRIVEKIRDWEIKNLRLVAAWMDDPTECFDDGEIDKIYLNFSDPWPKKKHAKRRLTYHTKLQQYRKVMGAGHILEFKTDNDGLFDFSLEEFAAEGYETLDISRDLHNSPYAEGNIKTEYEEKFSGFGKNINFIRLKV